MSEQLNFTKETDPKTKYWVILNNPDGSSESIESFDSEKEAQKYISENVLPGLSDSNKDSFYSIETEKKSD